MGREKFKFNDFFISDLSFVIQIISGNSSNFHILLIYLCRPLFGKFPWIFVADVPKIPNFLLFPQVRAERQEWKWKILTGKIRKKTPKNAKSDGSQIEVKFSQHPEGKFCKSNYLELEVNPLYKGV